MPKKSNAAFSFAEQYQALQTLMAWFEREDIDLDEGVRKLEEGKKIVSELKQYLQTVENKIIQLKKD